MIFVQNFTQPDFQAKSFWKNLHRWQNFYTAAGSDGMDKSHLWLKSGVFGSDGAKK